MSTPEQPARSPVVPGGDPASSGLGARLARNSLHSASGRIVAIVAWLVVTPWLLRALGPEGFGVWSLFYALAGWLGAMDFGFSQVALRFGAAARARGTGREGGEYATLALLGYVALGVLWLGLVLLLRDGALDLLRIPEHTRGLAVLALIAGAFVFVLAGLANTTSAALQAWDRFDLANGVTLVASLAQVGLLAVVLSRGGGFAACLAAVTAGWLAAFVVGILLLAAGVPEFRWGSITGALRRVPESVRFGMPLQLSNGTGVAHQQVGKLLLVRLVSLAAVVPYELALRVSTACFTFAQLVMVAMVPEASVLHARAELERLESLHVRAGRFVTAAATVVTAALLAAASPLFTAWLGHDDASAVLALRGLALAAYAATVGGVSGAIARGVGRTDLELQWSGVALVIHTVLAIWWIPGLGLSGALLALIVANVVASLWFVGRLGHALGWRVGRMLWEPFLVPGLAIAVGACAGNWLAGLPAPAWGAAILAAAVAAAGSLAVLFALGHIRLAELMSLVRRGVAPR